MFYVILEIKQYEMEVVICVFRKENNTIYFNKSVSTSDEKCTTILEDSYKPSQWLAR